MLKRILIASVLAIAPVSAFAASSNVNSLSASPAITGAQLLYCPIGAATDYKCTFTQVDAFINGQFSGDATVNGTGVVTVGKIGGKAVTLSAALTTTGAGAPTLAFPGTSQTYTFPAINDTLVTLTATQTLTNKSIAASEINSGQIALANGGTNANITATAGGVIYSGASALAVTAAGSSGQCLGSNGTSAPSWISCGSGSGTVTSVGETFTGGLISVSGSPVTTSGTLALTVAGTAGGLPYFATSSSWSSMGAGTSGQCLLSGGAGAPTWGSCSGGSSIAFPQIVSGTVNQGGVIYANDATHISVNATGTSGYFLQSQNTNAPTWSTAVTSVGSGCGTATGGSAITTTGSVIANIAVNPQTTAYTFVPNDCGNLVTLSSGSAQTDQLYGSLGSGFFVNVMNLGAGTRTIKPNPTTETICGIAGTTGVLLTQTQGMGFVFDGTNWQCTGGPYMTGPTSATNSDVASFNGTTGQILQDSGKALPTGAIVGTTDTQTLTNKTFTSPTSTNSTVTGSFTATGLVTLGDLATQGANTVTANVSGSTASPTAASLPSCSANGSILQYTSGTGFNCVTAAPLPTPGSGSQTLSGTYGYYVCTSTCSITLPTPAAGYQFCILNDDNVSTVITMAATASIQYETTARTSYKAANTAIASGGAAGDKICWIGRDATHWIVGSYVGTWS